MLTSAIAATTLESPASRAEQVLTFLLGTELFAIGILHVKEIIEYGRVTPVPMMPAWIRGVINLRGAVVPVIDLALRLERPTSTNTARTCIVVVEVESDGERTEVGLVVDAVSAVVEFAAGQIESPAAMNALLRRDFVRGMGKTNGRFVILLDAEKVLSDSEPAASGKPELNENLP
jgi:purine-binding chemotaxis protein CheW